MTTDKQIRAMIEDAIPLNPKCEVERTRELARRAALRIQIERLLRDQRKQQPYEPREEIK